MDLNVEYITLGSNFYMIFDFLFMYSIKAAEGMTTKDK